MSAFRPSAGAGRRVVLGRVNAPFGLDGWVKVTSYTDPAENIVEYPGWRLGHGSDGRTYEVAGWKRAGRGLAVRLEGVGSLEQARALAGCDVSVDREVLPEPAPGEHYLDDLIGLEAVNGEGVALGRVAGFLDLPAHPVLVLEGDRERLVPLVSERLLGVDLAGGRVTLDWHPDD